VDNNERTNEERKKFCVKTVKRNSSDGLTKTDNISEKFQQQRAGCGLARRD